MSATLTDRQRRELEFYEEFSELNPISEVCFDAILGKETRPWNSYWHVIETAKQHFRSGDQRLLDFGCGKGENSVIFARIGYEVSGFDLSPNNISVATRLAEKHELADRTHFSVSVAEKLDYPDEHFDVIVGMDILHHVDIAQALNESWRVLKTGGLAIFHEPIRVPIFDALRETRVGRWLVPKEASLERHITHDERKLADADLDLLRARDSKLSAERFLLVSRLDRFIRDPNGQQASFLEKMDYRICRLLPVMKRFGGIVVVTLRK
jgi:2-polyprenyl-3-methyl-5-hydroxy-6-metoxy-1,4-benzoquinol methylase